MWKKLLLLSLLSWLFCSASSLVAQPSEAEADPMLQIKQSELTELMSLIETLEQSNAARLIELETSNQLYSEREIYWQQYKLEMERVKTQNRVLTSLVFGLATTTAVSTFLLFLFIF